MVNRSQHDINTNVDMKNAIAAEAAFFDARCVLTWRAGNRCVAVTFCTLGAQHAGSWLALAASLSMLAVPVSPLCSHVQT